MKKILVPCDFSKQSNEAYKVALELATQSKSEIFLLHVFAITNLYTTGFAGEPLPLDPAYFERMENDVKKEMQRMQKKGTEKLLKITIDVIYGDLTTSVKDMVEKHQIDLVIMGTSGSSGLTEIFIGSHTEKVVRFSPVPVLAIRKAVDLKSIKNILLPSTLDLNQSDFIKKIVALQEFFNATLHILLVNTPTHFRRDAEANEALEKFVKHYKLSNYKLHFKNYSHEDEGIMEFAHAEKMDLIAMGTHARKGLAHLFNNSLTEKVVNHVQSPIWTYCLKA